MSTEIKPIDGEHIAIIETIVVEQLVAKTTLVAQRVELLSQIAKIDEKLELFVER